MKLSQFLVCLFIFASAVPFVRGKEEDENDDDGFFYFDDSQISWTNGGINPISCITTSSGDYVVYSIYGTNGNTCSKGSKGTYKMPAVSFVRAYIKQLQHEYELKGNEYKPGDGVRENLSCNQYYYNGQSMYTQIGCKNTGKAFQVTAYTDSSCTTSTGTTIYNNDISNLKVNFGACKTCTLSSSYGNYGNNGGGYYSMNNHESPLCATAWYHKESCNYSCKRAAKKLSNSSKSSSFGAYHAGFSAVEKFFLWFLSLSAVFFLLAGLAQRKKMSKEDALIEEAAIKSAGIDKKFIPRILLGIVVFIILMILLRRKVLTWLLLIFTNAGLLGYWMYLKKKAEKNAAVSNFHLYGDGGTSA
jgi:hypothetical protein